MAKPKAAMLENDGVGQRSGVRPFEAGVRFQKKLKVRCCRVSRKATVSGGVPGPPELCEQAPRARAKQTAVKRLRPIRTCTRRRAAGDAGHWRDRWPCPDWPNCSRY